MTIILSLRSQNDQLTAYIGTEQLAGPTSITQLPNLDQLQQNPYQHGLALSDALGGEQLLQRLQQEPDRLLLLDADEAAQAIPWEYATLPGQRFLVTEVGFLRLIDRPTSPPPANTSLQFVALAADPLVGPNGEEKPPYDLDLQGEMQAIHCVLQESGKAVYAQRIPPTKADLRTSLKKGPAILHFSCHGGVDSTPNGPIALLYLEDKNGKADILRGDDFVRSLPSGVVRLIVLSACHSADGQANLAQALVQNGLPAAIGMQGPFPDALSDELASTLYNWLLAGQPLGEALRQARWSLFASEQIWATGLPVAYVSQNGWQPLAIPDGTPQLGSFGLPGRTNLVPETQPPMPLLGRHQMLHQLASLYDEYGRGVVTIAGAGGIGKTALAASFAARFAWRWPDGVASLSFASGNVAADAFRTALWAKLSGQHDPAFAQLPPTEQETQLLAGMQQWHGLLLLDNYETILQQPDQAGAEAIHRLVSLLANGGQALLLTSREQPAQLADEKLFPSENRTLPGLPPRSGADLFLRHSSRTREAPDRYQPLAQQVAQVTEGHPLAILLLAAEFNVTGADPTDFLANWDEQLAKARQQGLAEHHITFAVAFGRSYDRLTAEEQRRLRLLAVYEFPFLEEGAAFMWGMSLDEDAMPTLRRQLRDFTRRSLLEAEGYYQDTDQPASYRFQPALRQQLRRQLYPTDEVTQKAGMAAYGDWLTKLGYRNYAIYRDIALNRIVFVSLPLLKTAATILTEMDQLWHIRRLAWILESYGQLDKAYTLLQTVLSPTDPLPDPTKEPELAKVNSSLRHQLADIFLTRGDLEDALSLYRQSIDIKEQLGDKQGKALSLVMIAQVFLIQGNLEKSLNLTQQSINLLEELGDKRGIANALHQMAQIFSNYDGLGDAPLELYRQSLNLLEQLGDKRGQATSFHQMAQIFIIQGNLRYALLLYQQGLNLYEQLGDNQGKAVSLSNMANIFISQKEWNIAETFLQKSLELAKESQQIEVIALNNIKLGRVAGIRGDRVDALSYYREGLTFFQQIGMSHKIKQMQAIISQPKGASNIKLSSLLKKLSPEEIQQLVQQIGQLDPEMIETVRQQIETISSEEFDELLQRLIADLGLDEEG